MYTIPNSADAFNSRQAQPDSVDFSILAQEHQAQGVRYGLAVTQRGAGANMSVDVAVGRMVWNGLDISNAVVVTNKTIAAADATNPRFDLVCAKNDGTLTVTTGTPATNPVFPSVPASSVVLAAVYVPANAASILTSYAIDKRCLIQRVTGNPPPITANTMDDEFDDTPGNSGLVNGLNVRWAWRNQSTTTATYEQAGYITLTPPASALNWRIIEQTKPAAQDYTVEAKLSLEGTTANSVRGGLVVVDGVHGDFYSFEVAFFSNTAIAISVLQWTAVAGAATFRAGLTTSGMQNAIYLRIAYINGTTVLSFWFSTNGISWVRMHSVADAVVHTTVGIGVDEENSSGLTKLHCDYFRRVA